jgi:translation initiation factor 2 beta subunit (eIF-2beta)/eIF-5
MNQKVNIGGDRNDPNYRYKRDRLVLSKTNKKGGIIHITNMQQILKQLHTSSHFEDKFYQKLKQTGIHMISAGAFKGGLTVEKAESILEILISKYILCPKCRLPELRKGVCRACGYSKPSKRSTSPQDDYEPVLDIRLYLPVESQVDNKSEQQTEEEKATRILNVLYDIIKNKESGYQLCADQCDMFWNCDTELQFKDWNEQASILIPATDAPSTK